MDFVGALCSPRCHLESANDDFRRVFDDMQRLLVPLSSNPKVAVAVKNSDLLPKQIPHDIHIYLLSLELSVLAIMTA